MHFATLECELVDRRRFATKAEARIAIFSFIQDWYNPRRRHSGLSYNSPIRFEENYLIEKEKPSEKASAKPGQLH